MSVSGHQVADHFRAQASTLSSLIERHRELLGTLKERDQQLSEQLIAARRELASVYLRALDDDNIARAAKLTGFQGFTRRDPRLAREHERKVLQSTLGKIEADERYQKRDVLAGPDGTLTQELDQNREALASLQNECNRFEQLQDFSTLIAIGYDTPAFQEKWWQASYWKHWAAGDRICKELGLADFGDDVIPAYTKVAEPRDFMRGEVERLGKQVDAIHELVREHDRIVDRTAHLDEIYLSDAQDFLGEHLMNADAALLEEWAKGEPELLRAVQMGVRKIAGLQAKRSILVDMSQSGVPQMIGQLEERQQKAYRKYNKFSRPKYGYAHFDNSTIDHGFADKSKAMQGQIDKLHKRIDHLMANQNYAGFDLRNDPYLWWWYFMESAPPRYAPHYYDYYQRHPSFDVVTDPSFVDEEPDRSEDVARAFAANEALEQGGYLS
jgi:flagellar biosynthesis chaperone FliJ